MDLHRPYIQFIRVPLKLLDINCEKEVNGCRYILLVLLLLLVLFLFPLLQNSGFLGNFAVTNEPPRHCLQCKLSRSLVLFSDTSGEKLTKVRKEEGSLIRVLFPGRHVRLHWLNTIIVMVIIPFLQVNF